MKKRMIETLLVMSLVFLTGCDGCRGFGSADETSEKPVIYLYPEKRTEVSVKLNSQGRLTSTWPAYGEGWKVTAEPDGTLTDESGREYYCLFWEGEFDVEYDFTEGFVVPGDETGVFLEQALAQLGLTEREADEFIIYWLPRMEGNAFNLISFQSDVYTDSVGLDVTPSPDTLIRVFMAWKPLKERVWVPEQSLLTPDRVGFTVVEWGGCEVKETN